jgi:hypothetical protein
MKWILFIVSLAAAIALFACLVTSTFHVEAVERHFFGPATHGTENQRVFNSSRLPLAVVHLPTKNFCFI